MWKISKIWTRREYFGINCNFCCKCYHKQRAYSFFHHTSSPIPYPIKMFLLLKWANDWSSYFFLSLSNYLNIQTKKFSSPLDLDTKTCEQENVGENTKPKVCEYTHSFEEEAKNHWLQQWYLSVAYVLIMMIPHWKLAYDISFEWYLLKCVWCKCVCCVFIRTIEV